ncbi:MAG: hypothetical protein ACREX3_05895 [Gammaproteobacteria bacterium]
MNRQQYFGEDLYPTEAGFALAIKELQTADARAANLGMSDIIDVSYLDELSRSRFFRRPKQGGS